jgi:hypothetical protein
VDFSEIVRQVVDEARRKMGSGPALAVELERVGVAPESGRYSVSAVSNWCKGRAMPPSEVLLAAALLGGISIDAKLARVGAEEAEGGDDSSDGAGSDGAGSDGAGSDGVGAAGTGSAGTGSAGTGSAEAGAADAGAVERLREEVRDLRQSHGRLQALLMDLYARTGQPYPHDPPVKETGIGRAVGE